MLLHCGLCRLLLPNLVLMLPLDFKRGLLVLYGDCQFLKPIGTFYSSIYILFWQYCSCESLSLGHSFRALFYMMDYWNRSVDINSVYRLTHCPPAINLFLAAMFYCGLPFCQPFLKAATAVSRPLFLWHFCSEFWRPTPPPELASPDGTIPRNGPPSDLSHPNWNRLLILIFLCGLTSNLVRLFWAPWWPWKCRYWSLHIFFNWSLASWFQCHWLLLW
jgi:hypothetical protein